MPQVTGWYCGHCSHGPHSIANNVHCASCGRQMDSLARGETSDIVLSKDPQYHIGSSQRPQIIDYRRSSTREPGLSQKEGEDVEAESHEENNRLLNVEQEGEWESTHEEIKEDDMDVDVEFKESSANTPNFAVPPTSSPANDSQGSKEETEENPGIDTASTCRLPDEVEVQDAPLSSSLRQSAEKGIQTLSIENRTAPVKDLGSNNEIEYGDYTTAFGKNEEGWASEPNIVLTPTSDTADENEERREENGENPNDNTPLPPWQLDDDEDKDEEAPPSFSQGTGNKRYMAQNTNLWRPADIIATGKDQDSILHGDNLSKIDVESTASKIEHYLFNGENPWSQDLYVYASSEQLPGTSMFRLPSANRRRNLSPSSRSQRALMRKIKACPECRRKKKRCFHKLATVASNGMGLQQSLGHSTNPISNHIREFNTTLDTEISNSSQSTNDSVVGESSRQSFRSISQTTHEQANTFPTSSVPFQGSLPSATDADANDASINDTGRGLDCFSRWPSSPPPSLAPADPHTLTPLHECFNPDQERLRAFNWRRLSGELDKNQGLSDFLEAETNSLQLTYPYQQMPMTEHNTRATSASNSIGPYNTSEPHDYTMRGAENRMQPRLGQLEDTSLLQTDLSFDNATWGNAEGDSNYFPLQSSGAEPDFDFPDFCDWQIDVDIDGQANGYTEPDAEKDTQTPLSSPSGVYRLVNETPRLLDNTGILDSDTAITPPVNSELSKDEGKGKDKGKGRLT